MTLIYVMTISFLFAIAPARVEQSGQVMRVSERVLRTNATKSELPQYPGEAKTRQIQGVAVAQVEVDEKGEVAIVEIMEAPHSAIKRVVTMTVRRWKFKPFTINRSPVRARGKLTFYFVIEGKKFYVKNPS